VFDPYLASRPLAETLKQQPAGDLIVDDQYYAFSSVFFYADLANGPNDGTTRRRAWLLNGRVNNLEYGSNAPGAPAVFLADGDLAARWGWSDRFYLICEKPRVARFEKLLGRERLKVVAESGGKVLFRNYR
jgi:hypothetical protein